MKTLMCAAIKCRLNRVLGKKNLGNTKFFITLHFTKPLLISPRSGRLELVGARKNEHLRRRHECLPRAHPFSLVPTTSMHLLHRLTANLPGEHKNHCSCQEKSCTKLVLHTLYTRMYHAPCKQSLNSFICSILL